MAEAVGLVVGVVPLSLQLAESIQKAKRFYNAVKDAPERLAEIIDEIETFSDILADMESDRTSCNADSGPTLQRCVAICRKAIDRFSKCADGFESRMKRQKHRGCVRFAMKAQNIEYEISRLERLKVDLVLAYMLYCKAVDEARGAHMQLHLDQMKSQLQHLVIKNATHLQQTSGSSKSCVLTTGTKKTSKQISSGGSTEFRLRTPSWLSHTIWEICSRRAAAEWTVSLRAYSIVPHDAAIFKACEHGDIRRMRELFDGGFASPFDENEFGKGIFEVALWYAQIDVARFLQKHHFRALKPMQYWACIGPQWYCATGSPPAPESWRVLREASISTLRDTIHFLIEDCDNPLTEQPIHSYGYPDDYVELDQFIHGNLRDAVFVWFWTSVRHFASCAHIKQKLDMVSPPVDMDHLIGSNDFDSHFRDTHVLVLAKAYMFSSDDVDIRYWEKLFIKAIKLGLDVHDGGDGVSPLLHILHATIDLPSAHSELRNKPPRWKDPLVPPRIQIQAMHARLKNWLSLLKRAGVDLFLYGQEERRLLADVQGTCEHPWIWSGRLHDCRVISEELMVANPEFSYDKHNMAALFTFDYGPDPDDWELWLCHPGDRYAGPFWSMVEGPSHVEVEHHVERHVPGSWLED